MIRIVVFSKPCKRGEFGMAGALFLAQYTVTNPPVFPLVLVLAGEDKDVAMLAPIGV